MQVTSSKPQSKGNSVPVELIAGPLCGLEVDWPPGNMHAGFVYYGGICVYELEQEGKAVYLGEGRPGPTL